MDEKEIAVRITVAAVNKVKYDPSIGLDEYLKDLHRFIETEVDAYYQALRELKRQAPKK